ncbi:MAG: KH domain-containing protein [Candidatus Micrarchaeota archaeon]|nr:KH domain-containing protein [Candidatus Micrarchaeota archaeon]
MQIVKIPTERIKILMSNAKYIEDKGNVHLSLSNEEGISITSEDPIAEWKGVNVVKAIGRGFSPEIAVKLFSDEYTLHIINLKEIFSKEKQRIRIKARLIGTKGKTRATIEELSGSYVCIYGNTISFIGKLEEVSIAVEAANMIINGASHGAVYMFLQKERKKMESLNFRFL